MQITPYIFRNYDIRAKYPDEIDAVKVEAIGKSYGTFLRRRKIRQAVVGYDCRITGPEFHAAYINGLTSTGVDVIDIGMCMTQMVYFGQYYFQTNGATMITASHNPKNFNGFKIATAFSQTTLPDDVKELREAVEQDKYFVAETKGTVTKTDIYEAHKKDLLKRVEIKKKLKVLVDFRHGTPALFIPGILREAGCEVTTKNDTVDGNFPTGTPDPTDEHYMKGLGEEVKNGSFDLGLCYDGDGDRIGMVDEKGRIMWNDIMVAIFAQEILERFPGSKIVYNNLCSQVVPWAIKKSGGIPIMWLTGHAFIKDKISMENAAFGGELSGHFFFRDNFFGFDDGGYGTLRILEHMSEKNLKMSDIFDSFPKYFSSPEVKIGCPDDKKKEVIRTLSEKFKKDFPNGTVSDEHDIPGNDGARIDFEDGMMIFRYSQNGPYITVRFEAKEEKVYNMRKNYTREILESYPEMIWEDELCVNLDSLK
jgi:phosphomannomutase / phosphoglucomutase